MDQSKYRKAIVLSQEQRKKREEKQNDQTKITLREKIKSHVMTLGIGTISDIEDIFGFLWGHGKPTSKLNDSEREWRDIWNQLRTSILDNVNKRIRNIDQGIEHVNVSVKKFTIEGRKI
jgi:hypothetical protein